MDKLHHVALTFTAGQAPSSKNLAETTFGNASFTSMEHAVAYMLLVAKEWHRNANTGRVKDEVHALASISIPGSDAFIVLEALETSRPKMHHYPQPVQRHEMATKSVRSALLHMLRENHERETDAKRNR